jgi:UDP-N-acetylbacillosamine N-acetyltransferase
MKKIVIWGASGHAIVIADILRLQGEYEVFGYLDSVNSHRHGTMFHRARILGGEEQLERLLSQRIYHIIMGFGNCDARLSMAERIKPLGFELALAIHPSAIIASDVVIKAGTVVAAGAVINPGCQVGENVIINTSSSIDHECVIEDGAHISPGVHLAGKVTIGRAAWIGIGTSIIDHTSIGSGTIIGAGSVVVRDIPDRVVAYGNPAKVRKQR